MHGQRRVPGQQLFRKAQLPVRRDNPALRADVRLGQRGQNPYGGRQEVQLHPESVQRQQHEDADHDQLHHEHEHAQEPCVGILRVPQRMEAQQQSQQPDQEGSDAQQAVQGEHLAVIMEAQGDQEVPENIAQVAQSAQGYILAAVIGIAVDPGQHLHVVQISQAGKQQRQGGPSQLRQSGAQPVLFLRSLSPLRQHGAQHRAAQQGHGTDHQLAHTVEARAEGHRRFRRQADPEAPALPEFSLSGTADNTQIQAHRQHGQNHVEGIIIMEKHNPAVGDAEGQQQRGAGQAETVEGNPRLARQKSEGAQHHQLHHERAEEAHQGPVGKQPEKESVNDLAVDHLQLRGIKPGGGQDPPLPGQLLPQDQLGGGVAVQQRGGHGPGGHGGDDYGGKQHRHAEQPLYSGPQKLPVKHGSFSSRIQG